MLQQAQGVTPAPQGEYTVSGLLYAKKSVLEAPPHHGMPYIKTEIEQQEIS
jgi:hypothetical protein